LMLAGLLALALVSDSAAHPALVRYHLDATVDGGDLAGSETIEIDPVGGVVPSEVVLFLFPNLLRERLPFEDSRSFYTIQPVRWRASPRRPGGLRRDRCRAMGDPRPRRTSAGERGPAPHRDCPGNLPTQPAPGRRRSLRRQRRGGEGAAAPGGRPPLHRAPRTDHRDGRAAISR